MPDIPGPHGTTWSSELLGYPSDARVLILNNDDFGMYPAINAAVVESIERGVAASCSLMVPCPSAVEAMRLLREHPAIPFGIHLTLVRDSTDYRWGPLTARDKVPSLLDGQGDLFQHAGISDLLARARLAEVELELRAQIETVIDAGLMPTHLDWHSIADAGRDDIFDLTMGLAREYGLAARVWLAPGRTKAREQSLPVVDHPFVDSYHLDLDGKQARYAELLRTLPAGLSEWAVHPSIGDGASRAIDPMGWRQRRADYDFLMSREARDVIAQEGIVVIDYRPIQRAWKAGGPPDPRRSRAS